MPLIYFVTLSRSDYASLRPVARAALNDADIDAKIIVGGSHLLSRFGNTIQQIEGDGISIHAEAAFLSESDDTPEEIARAYARAVSLFVDIFAKGNPDYVFVIGDRWEMLAVVSAASMLQIPVIHHSGGDITEGSSDNQTRYALSCLSHIHLTALPEHRDRLLAMGEEPWRVIATGEPALAELENYAKSVPDVRGKLGLKPSEEFVLATFHPTSFDIVPVERQIDLFLQSLDLISGTVILTAPNPDAASGIFLQKLKNYAETHKNIRLHDSLGAENYYAAMAAASYMIGNSSSGLWEAPSFNLPVINIGMRQQGRVHGKNVINVPLEISAIKDAIAQVSNPGFRKKISGGKNPYVRSDTISLILESLKKPHDKSKLLAKRFIDPLAKAPR